MTHNNPAARSVAVQQNCAEKAADGATYPSDRMVFAPFDRWQLIDLVTEVRKGLKLTSNDISVLRALVSFLPVRKSEHSRETVTPQTLTIVFASNRAISHRAGGIDERVLRHAFRRLQAAGLIHRRDSATGKRFPIRIRGKIVDAFGLDIAPAFAMAPNLMHAVEEQREETDKRHALRSEIFSVRKATLSDARSIPAEVSEWFSGLTKILRRNLNLVDLQQILTEAKTFARQCCPFNRPDDPAPIAEPQNKNNLYARGRTHCRAHSSPVRCKQNAGSDGKNYRHIESEKRKDILTSTVSRVSLRQSWDRCQEISEFFPDVPNTLQQFVRALYDFAKLLGLRDGLLAFAANIMTWTQIAACLDYIAKHSVRLRSPSAYFQKIVQDVQNGNRPQWLSAN